MAQEDKLKARNDAASAGGSLHTYLSAVDEFIGTHGRSGHVVGAELTIADFAIFAASSIVASGFFDGIDSAVLSDFKK